MNKIGIIGVGAVGSSYLYASLNRNIEAEYVLIDAFESFAIAQAKDLNDAASSMISNGSTFVAGNYDDLKDAKVIVITASVRPKEGKLQDRLELLSDNAILMQEIALKIKASGFNGITVIASNPVDIMASIYQQVSGFDASKVISSGTILETARMKKFLSQKLNVKSSAITGYVIGEHGARCMIPFWKMRIGLCSLRDFITNNTIDQAWLDELNAKVKNEAFEIISGKGITNFGIGEGLAEITKAIVNDVQTVFSLGVQLPECYQAKGVYFGLPVILGKEGYRHLPKIRLEEKDQALFDSYSTEIKETVLEVLKRINTKPSGLISE
ncbi:lactate/malate family dehydrogenase [[Mycoplasma] anseris]|uniref:Lactate dehydrogenase n=1 Tax=[Mycoplasma] anseris TaxID=92400 RepID=A0A2Z4NCN8_9BACT|nr:lactate dehydrogenase [[Mycoplasma] anseris]AWX69333.1 lactate dehydrogenase [[Mycoplasma] anseris]